LNQVNLLFAIITNYRNNCSYTINKQLFQIIVFFILLTNDQANTVLTGYPNPPIFNASSTCICDPASAQTHLTEQHKVFSHFINIRFNNTAELDKTGQANTEKEIYTNSNPKNNRKDLALTKVYFSTSRDRMKLILKIFMMYGIYLVYII